MKRKIILLSIILFSSCSQDKSQYYVLAPVDLHKPQSQSYPHLRIGIIDVNVPGYLDKQQLAYFCTKNHSKLDENNLWAEDLSSNVKRVLKANLEVFIPGAIVENAPWDSKFNPNYQLQVDINQFNVIVNGNSVLDADYLIFHDDELIRHYRVTFHRKSTCVDPNALVKGMNDNVTRLSQDIAKRFVSRTLLVSRSVHKKKRVARTPRDY